MSFKIHLIIVSIIIIAVYFFWQAAGNKPPQPVADPNAPPPSKYSIKITHATWGKNCDDDFTEIKPKNSDPYAYNPLKPAIKAETDNVLALIAGHCDGKLKCTVFPSAESLGDPAPECRAKKLEIEYRCFAYDRPWQVESTNQPISIDCDLPDSP